MVDSTQNASRYIYIINWIVDSLTRHYKIILFIILKNIILKLYRIMSENSSIRYRAISGESAQEIASLEYHSSPMNEVKL